MRYTYPVSSDHWRVDGNQKVERKIIYYVLIGERVKRYEKKKREYKNLISI